jgi:nucleoside-diphosphate-sugar epimerase
MSTSILVTGGAGFIGSFLCEQLLTQGYSVIAIDNLFRGKIENIAHLKNNPAFSFIELDLSLTTHIQKVQKILVEQHVKVIFHLAAINGTQHFYDHAYFVLDQNSKLTQNVLAATENTEVNKIIYTSSSEVYGEPMILPTPETHPILLNAFADRDSYASSKALGDFYVRLHCQHKNIDYLILRIFNMYGERMVNTRYGQVIPEFIKRTLSSDQEFTIIGDGQHTRSFCYIKDATIAMVQLMQQHVTGFLNLGNDQEISILELAQTIHQILKRPFKPKFLPERPHDHKRRCPDLTRLKTILPELKFTSLHDGLTKVIKYYQDIKDQP